MYQTIFIKFLQINQINFNIRSEIEKLSSIYKFNIKKIFDNKNGVIIEINANFLPLLKNNSNIIIIYQNEFYNDSYLNEYLKYKKIK
jgi:hypothetical protein